MHNKSSVHPSPGDPARETESHQGSSTANAAAAGQDRRAQKAAETAARIERVGLELFARYGYHKVTVEQIAEAAGIGRATVFRHFPAKEEIVFANSASDEAVLRAALRAHPTAGKDRAELAAALATYVESREQHGDLVTLRIRVVDATEDLRPRVLLHRAMLAEIIAEELAMPIEPPLPRRVRAAGIVAALQFSLREWEASQPRCAFHPIVFQALAPISFHT